MSTDALARTGAVRLQLRRRRASERNEFDVDQARALESFAGVQNVGLDETSLRRGQHGISVVDDLDAKRLLFATEGRDHRKVLDLAKARHICETAAVFRWFTCPAMQWCEHSTRGAGDEPFFAFVPGKFCTRSMRRQG